MYIPTRRRGERYIEWRKSVLDRDGNKCTKCLSTDKLDPHHIKEWDEFPELRLNIDNGLTLCRKCHMSHHKNKKGHKVGTAWNKGLKTGIAPWKGKKFSEEHRKKLSDEKKSNINVINKLVELGKSRKGIPTSRPPTTKGKKMVIDLLTGKRKYIERELYHGN